MLLAALPPLLLHPAAAEPAATIDGYADIGPGYCVQSVAGPRVQSYLCDGSGTHPDPCSFTLASCAALCSGYTHFGLQYYSLCFCGNEYGRLGAGNRPDCNTPCEGDALTVCGGYQRNSIYALKSASRRDVIAGGADETFEYVGCYVDTAERSQMMMFSRFVALSARLANPGGMAVAQR